MIDIDTPLLVCDNANEVDRIKEEYLRKLQHFENLSERFKKYDSMFTKQANHIDLLEKEKRELKADLVLKHEEIGRAHV